MPTTTRSRRALGAVIGSLSLTSFAGIAAAQDAAPQAPAPAAPAPPAAPPAAASAAPAAPQAAEAPSSEKDARAAVSKMADAYKALKSFSATVEDAVKTGDKTQTTSTKVAFQTGKARAEAVRDGGKTTVIFDGSNLFAADSSDTKKYSKAAVTNAQEGVLKTLGSTTRLGLIALLLSDPGAGDKILPPSAKSVVLDPKGDTVNGTAVQVVTSDMPQFNGSVRLDIGKDDNLLRRVTLQVPTKDNGTVVLTETYNDVQANPTLDPALFKFTPAPGAVVENAATQSAPYDPRLKAGAAPLPFSGTDTAGKPVSLAQYKGKVVLLDFWATWCPPCRAEVPNVVSVYNRYHSKGFDIVGVSLDQPGDKPKLVSFTSQNKMPWRQIYDGGYWQAKLAKAYGIQAIPFTLLIGKDGRIAAVDPRGEQLEPAVKAALAK